MTVEVPKILNVGLIMPISAIDDCPVEHWVEVQSIFVQALNENSQHKCDVRLVSDAENADILHKRIIKNVYDKDIVICDVSCKNPNVMFELGMRLAFDKPTVIVKDDQTDYIFDTGPIEHVPYPRNLRFSKIVEFKRLLASKVDATYKVSQENPDSTFLKSFGEFRVASLHETQVPAQTLIVDMLQEMQADLALLKWNNRNSYLVDDVPRPFSSDEIANIEK